MSDVESGSEAGSSTPDAAASPPAGAPSSRVAPPPSEALGLKAFHVVFICASITCAIGVGVWGIRDYAQSGSGAHLGLGIASLVVSVVLLVYGRWFLRKLKGLA